MFDILFVLVRLNLGFFQLDSLVLCKISCFRKNVSGQRQSNRERGKGKSGDLTAMDYFERE